MSSEFPPDPEAVHPVPYGTPQAHMERYELFEQLGRGGMGTVFRAMDRDLGRIVAIKVLHPELSSNLRYLLQLKREIVLGSRIHSPHVVRVHDMATLAGSPVITMDWIEGESLFALLARVHTLPPSQACDFAVQICHGLQAIHSAHIVHRDLKPSNLLIAKNGRVLVSDFGFARSVLPGEMNLSVSGENSGTLMYMAPEQFAGISADCRSDLYSFGLVLLQMLTGTTTLETLYPLRERLMSSSTLEKYAKSGELRKLAILDLVVRKCLQMDRTDRYSTASEILMDLQLAASDATDTIRRRTELGQRSTAWIANRALTATSVAVLLVIAGVVIIKVRASGGAKVAPSLTSDTQEDPYTAAKNYMTGESGESDLRIAVRFLEQATESRPGDISAQRAYVDVLIRLYERTHEMEWLTRARKANHSTTVLEKHETVLFDARIDLNLGHYADVIRIFAADWPAWRSLEEANRYMGRALEESDESARSLLYYREAVRLAPESWLAHNDLGSALFHLGRLNEARVQFTNVIRLNPSSRSGYSNLGVILLHEGDFTQARRNFEIALQRGASPEAYDNLAVADYYAHQFATSIPFLEAAIKMRPDSSKYAAGLADALWHSGQRPAARAACGRAISLLEQLSSNRVLNIEEECRRARCLGRVGDFADAALALKRFSTSDAHKDPIILYSRAVLAAQEGHPVAAQRWLTLALDHGYSRALASRDPEFVLVTRNR